MDWNRVQGSWKQLEGKIKAKWGQLTADDLTAINGRREELEGKIQQRYGLAKDQARKEIDDWFVTRLLTQGFEGALEARPCAGLSFARLRGRA